MAEGSNKRSRLAELLRSSAKSKAESGKSKVENIAQGLRKRQSERASEDKSPSLTPTLSTSPAVIAATQPSSQEMEASDNAERDTKNFCPLCSKGTDIVPLMAFEGDLVCSKTECMYSQTFWKHLVASADFPLLYGKPEVFPDLQRINAQSAVNVPVPEQHANASSSSSSNRKQKQPTKICSSVAQKRKIGQVLTSDNGHVPSEANSCSVTRPPLSNILGSSSTASNSKTTNTSDCPKPQKRARKSMPSTSTLNSVPSSFMLDGLTSLFSKFVIWPHGYTISWLNSSLSLLLHSGSLRRYADENPDSPLQLVKSYRQYIGILEMVSTDSCEIYQIQTKLHDMQNEVHTYLEHDPSWKEIELKTPHMGISGLIKENKDLVDMFILTHAWQTSCIKCTASTGSLRMKTIISFQQLSGGFDMMHPVTFGGCPKCLAENQQKELLFDDLPQSFIFHFENGIPSRDLSLYDVDFNGYKYQVKGFILYVTSNVRHNHFVTWIKDMRTNLWLNCDEFQKGIHILKKEPLTFNPAEVYILMWERTSVVAMQYIPKRLPTIASDMFDSNLVIDMQDSSDELLFKKDTGSPTQKRPSDSPKTTTRSPGQHINLPDFSKGGYNFISTNNQNSSLVSEGEIYFRNEKEVQKFNQVPVKVVLQDILPLQNFIPKSPVIASSRNGGTIHENSVDRSEVLDESSYTEYVEPDGTKIQKLKDSHDHADSTSVQSSFPQDHDQLTPGTSDPHMDSSTPVLETSVSSKAGKKKKKKRSKEKDSSSKKKSEKKNKKTKKGKSPKKKKTEAIKSKKTEKKKASKSVITSASMEVATPDRKEDSPLYKSSKTYDKRSEDQPSFAQSALLPALLLQPVPPAGTTGPVAAASSSKNSKSSTLIETTSSLKITVPKVTIAPIKKSVTVVVYPQKKTVEAPLATNRKTRTAVLKASQVKETKMETRTNSLYNLRRQPKPSEIGKLSQSNELEVDDWIAPIQEPVIIPVNKIEKVTKKQSPAVAAKRKNTAVTTPSNETMRPRDSLAAVQKSAGTSIPKQAGNITYSTISVPVSSGVPNSPILLTTSGLQQQPVPVLGTSQNLNALGGSPTNSVILVSNKFASPTTPNTRPTFLYRKDFPLPGPFSKVSSPLRNTGPSSPNTTLSNMRLPEVLIVPRAPGLIGNVPSSVSMNRVHTVASVISSSPGVVHLSPVFMRPPRPDPKTSTPMPTLASNIIPWPAVVVASNITKPTTAVASKSSPTVQLTSSPMPQKAVVTALRKSKANSRQPLQRNEIRIGTKEAPKPSSPTEIVASGSNQATSESQKKAKMKTTPKRKNLLELLKGSKGPVPPEGPNIKKKNPGVVESPRIVVTRPLPPWSNNPFWTTNRSLSPKITETPVPSSPKSPAILSMIKSVSDTVKKPLTPKIEFKSLMANQSKKISNLLNK